MRDQSKLMNSLMSFEEKEYEARLFVDAAIKGKSEYTLAAVARALAGKNNITLEYAHEKPLFKSTDHIKGKDAKGKETFITVDKEYPIRAKMREFSFYGKSEMDIWVQVIKFYTVDVCVFPCGGASFPNREIETTFKSDKKK